MEVRNSFNMTSNQDNMRTNQNNMRANQTNIKDDRSSLSIDDFLQIMAAEIKNQNPMGSDGGGGSKTDYLTQLAQFTTLEQMTQIGENLNTLNYMGQQQYAFGLIGKEVTLLDGEGKVTGVVEKAKIVSGFATIQVGGKDYYLGSVVEVADKKVDAPNGDGDLPGEDPVEDSGEDPETEIDTEDTEVR